MSQTRTVTTQRAYTLRLRGVDPGDNAWRDALWATHEAVNKGAKVFGDWLLTLRGGLDHKLAEDANNPAERRRRRILLALSWLTVEDERGAPRGDLIVAYGDKCERGQDNQQSRHRKVEAALHNILSHFLKEDEISSWLADCMDSLTVSIRDDAVWVNRRESFDRANKRLGGALTQDAVWDLLKPIFGSPAKMLAPAQLGDDDDQTRKPFRAVVETGRAARPAKAVTEENTKAADTEDAPIAKDFVKQAGRWLSLRYKAAGGADYSAVADRYETIARVAEEVSATVTGSALVANIATTLGRDGEGREGIVKAVGYTGSKQRGVFFSRLKEIDDSETYSSADLKAFAASARDRADKLRQASAVRKASPKGPRSWSSAMLSDVADADRGCGFQYDPTVDCARHPTGETVDVHAEQGGANHGEYSVMLDHAMRRVSIAHSWIKRAEAARDKFEGDRARIGEVPSLIHDWLDEFFRQRGKDANAADGYSVRRRSLGGKHAKAWKAVVAAWMKCLSEDERRDAIGNVQSEWDDEEKFGHADLFISLAGDDARHIWNEGPHALIDYVAARDAESRAKRYKVPAFRHPHPYYNPVFTDFGYSRWRVEYEAHKARNCAIEAERTVAKKRHERDCYAIGSEQRRKGESTLRAAERRLTRLRAELARQATSSRIRLRLWDGEKFVWSNELSGGTTWQSSRLRKDLALDAANQSEPEQNIHQVVRADRLGRASARIANGDVMEVSNIFEEDHWNARLQAPRRELLANAARLANDKRPRALAWFVTFSARLESRGPFLAYAEKQPDIELDSKRDGEERLIQLAPPAKRRKSNEWRGLAFPFKRQQWEARVGHAKILLSRLPALRLLSVDLGHRFAAACAVWEALDATEFATALAEADAAGWRVEGSPDGLFVHIHRTADKVISRGRKKGEPVIETTVYRRIGADKLDNETKNPRPHPAPWARLERQFFIKLQGEERVARFAFDEDRELVSKMAEELKLVEGELLKETKSKAIRVDELMRLAMRMAALGLRRHGRAAKIAYAFLPDCPGIPGMGGKLKEITSGDEAHIRFLTDALADWHALAGDTEWDGRAARERWNKCLKGLPGGFGAPEPSPHNPDAECTTREERRKTAEELREKIKPIARQIANNPALTKVIFDEWERAWKDGDGVERTRDDFVHTIERDDQGKISSRTSPKMGKETGGGWYARLRTLTDWVMGWHLPGAQSKRWNRTIGGLSLNRIATMKSLYQLHKAFAMRPRPDDVRGAPETGESNSGVAQKILDTMDQMREQRVKQLASRIVEAALGVGSENPEHWEQARKRPAGPLENHPKGGRRFKACHAVVIENLRNYRPDELQTRRENRALMSWSSGKVRKYLEEACQLHGLHLREVMPNYTSRQCSRTGSPGIRCVDIPVDISTGEPNVFWWRRALKRAKGKGDAESRFLVALEAYLCEQRENGRELPKSVRLPRKGGDLFVAAPPLSCRARGHKPCAFCNGKRALQADLNAAANIGLRALLDPDWAGRWWYVPATFDKERHRVPDPDKCAGASCLQKWRVGRDGDVYTVRGKAVEFADDEAVRRAQDEFKTAEADYKQAKKQFQAAMRSKLLESVAAATSRLEAAKKSKEAAKNRRDEARKGAKSKSCVNLWRDSSALPLSDGAWFDYAAYSAMVRSRVVQMLRRCARLPDPEHSVAEIDLLAHASAEVFERVSDVPGGPPDS